MKQAEPRGRDTPKNQLPIFALETSATKTPTPILVSYTNVHPNTDATVKSSARSKTESIAPSATEIGSQLGLQVAPSKVTPSVMTKITRTFLRPG
jgi:hypothetical protein